MLIDTHVHGKPHSLCSQVPMLELPALFKQKGFMAFMLTNHFYEYHLRWLGNTYSEQEEENKKANNEVKKKGEEIGVKVFFGAEVRVTDIRIDENNNEVPFRPEFILFGLTEEILRKSLPLYELTQKELFCFANENNILMSQAHPYRTAQEHRPANMKYTHAVELYNGHPNFPTRIEDTLLLAKENNLFVTAGSDLHVAYQCGKAGMRVPDFIENSVDLAEFIKNNKPKNLNDNKLIIEF